MPKIRTLADLRARQREQTIAFLRAALRRHGGKVLPTAREIEVPQPTLHRLVRETYPELSAEAATATHQTERVCQSRGTRPGHVVLALLSRLGTKIFDPKEIDKLKAQLREKMIRDGHEPP